MSEFNVSESIKAQKEYCEREGAPHFAPRGGNCWNCNQNIYSSGRRYWKGKFEQRESEGISTKKAGSELVTGCPHCFRSYCD